MKILIIGNGGREHALCWKIAKSPSVDKIWVANGNAGTALEPKTSNLNIAPTEIDKLVTFAKKHAIDLTVVGPEAPLAAGIVDAFQRENLKCFGPTQKAAQLESSKAYCKQFLQQHRIPTAAFATFNSVAPALDYLAKQTMPIVIKADGLAAGKGVVIAETLAEAEHAVRDMLENDKFGAAGATVVIEEFLQGEELSFIAMVDGKHILPLASSQDHKRRDDGDKGPNTGGMGAYSPAPLLTEALKRKIMTEIMQPTVAALAAEGTPYVGFLYAGLMIDKNGNPKVLEFNCRLGDPETQPILFRLRSDLVKLCLAAFEGTLDTVKAEWDPRPAISVVLASGGYPESYEKGLPIQGLNGSRAHAKVFHASTTEMDNKILTAGGRVLTVTALGDTLESAREEAYQMAEQIHWPGCFYRKDIGYKALKKE